MIHAICFVFVHMTFNMSHNYVISL